MPQGLGICAYSKVLFIDKLLVCLLSSFVLLLIGSKVFALLLPLNLIVCSRSDNRWSYGLPCQINLGSLALNLLQDLVSFLLLLLSSFIAFGT